MQDAPNSKEQEKFAEFFFKVCKLSHYCEKYGSSREHFRSMCEASCENYGKKWVCPPFELGAETFFLGMENILIAALRIPAKFGGGFEKTYSTSRKVFDKFLMNLEEEVGGNSRAFFAGTCIECPLEKCTRALAEPSCCPFPEIKRESLEALGFNLAASCKEEFGFDLEWENEDAQKTEKTEKNGKKISLIGALGFSGEDAEKILSKARKNSEKIHFENLF